VALSRGLVPMAHLRGRRLKSSVSNRSIVIAGHKTSVSLEDEFWNSLKEIAGQRDMTVSELAIDREREHANLSSAIRLFVLGVYRDQLDHRKPTNLVYKPSVPERFQRTKLRFGIDAAAMTREAEEEMGQMTRFAGLETTGLKLGDVASCDTFQSARF